MTNFPLLTFLTIDSINGDGAIKYGAPLIPGSKPLNSKIPNSKDVAML